jgi:hypothetical protein
VIRERLGRLALRAYPREVGLSHGEEMLSTMLDVGAESRMVFALDLISLVIGGVRERARVTAGSGRRQLVTDACGIALVVYLLVPMGELLRSFTDWHSAQQFLITLTICVSVALLLVGYNRVAGTVGLFAIALGNAITIERGGPTFADGLNAIATMAVPAVCCAVLITDRRPQRPHPRRLLWLLVPLFALLIPRSATFGGILGLSYQQAFLVVVSVIGMLRLPYDPRLALGCGLAWSTMALRIIYEDIWFGLGSRFSETETTILWIAAVTVLVAVTRLALMRRPTTG